MPKKPQKKSKPLVIPKGAGRAKPPILPTPVSVPFHRFVSPATSQDVFGDGQKWLLDHSQVALTHTTAGEAQAILRSALNVRLIFDDRLRHLGHDGGPDGTR